MKLQKTAKIQRKISPDRESPKASLQTQRAKEKVIKIFVQYYQRNETVMITRFLYRYYAIFTARVIQITANIRFACLYCNSQTKILIHQHKTTHDSKQNRQSLSCLFDYNRTKFLRLGTLYEFTIKREDIHQSNQGLV